MDISALLYRADEDIRWHRGTSTTLRPTLKAVNLRTIFFGSLLKSGSIL